jgi:hypothetical protein
MKEPPKATSLRDKLDGKERIVRGLTYKNRIPPREKYAAVSAFNRKKTEPLMRACTMNVLGGEAVSTERSKQPR